LGVGQGLERIEVAQWLFNMVRSDWALGSMNAVLNHYLHALSLPVSVNHDVWSIGGEEWLVYASALVFASYRLSAVHPNLGKALDRLFHAQNVDGWWGVKDSNREGSIESTAMAIHAFALAKPRNWKSSAMRARAWLWSKQGNDGAWRERGIDPTYLTVLVLDAVNLAEESGAVTFAAFRNQSVSPKGALMRSIGTPEAVAACAQYIRQKALTQDEFGRIFGASGRTVRKFLKTGKMRTTLFREMAEKMGATPDELLRGDWPPQRS